jgi:hypothetical protein
MIHMNYRFVGNWPDYLVVHMNHTLSQFWHNRRSKCMTLLPLELQFLAAVGLNKYRLRLRLCSLFVSDIKIP